MKVNFGATAQDYATHRAGFPDAFFEALSANIQGYRGQAVVDLGTGTGTLARGFATRGCRVIGIDISLPLLQEAKRLDQLEHAGARYCLAKAEATGLPQSSVDMVTAGQCWHWFDRPRAAAEARRLLRPNGFVVIAHFDWIPLQGNVVEATEQLILAHNPDWKGAGTSGLYPAWLKDLGEAGFGSLRTFSFDVDVPYTPEGWRGRIRASAGVGASLPLEKIKTFDRALANLLEANYPGAILPIPHRVFAVIAQSPG